MQIAWLLALVTAAAAERVLRSTSLNTCQEDSQFTASLLNIVFTPNNNSAYVHIIGVSSIEGYAVFDITATAYGYAFLHKTIDPCEVGLLGLCPMVAAKIDETPFVLDVSADAVKQIPGIAYSFPDLDASVRVFINMTSGSQASQAAACLKLDVSNGRTIDLVGVQWASAGVVLGALLAAAAVRLLGHFNAATHIAVNTLALFNYMQAQAMIGLCATPLPPSARAWSQDFQWSLGLIHVGFMQSVLTWYQRSTGGTPSDLFSTLSDVSVSVQRRSLGTATKAAAGLVRRSISMARRAISLNSSGSYVVTGIQRAAFEAGIEPTNAFLTVIGFFTAIFVFVALLVLLFRVLLEASIWLRLLDRNGDHTHEFRVGWRAILKGVLFRYLLAAYPALILFSFWEFTQADSPAEIVDAVVLLLVVSLALAYGAYAVIRLASRSMGMHRTPAYLLFSDANILHKWGGFYVQFRASAYYFSVPLLGYTVIKAAFIGFSQNSGATQAVALIIIEALTLVGASVLRPWMDKSTNSFNITICVVNLLNAIMLLFFTGVLGQPSLGTGVIGLVFWILNAAVTLALLLMTIITTAIVFFQRNPDARYRFMGDDRTSFVKSQLNLAHNELEELAATARADYPAPAAHDGLLDDVGESDSMASYTRQKLGRPSDTDRDSTGHRRWTGTDHE